MKFDIKTTEWNGQPTNDGDVEDTEVTVRNFSAVLTVPEIVSRLMREIQSDQGIEYYDPSNVRYKIYVRNNELVLDLSFDVEV